ncbi:MAG: hypothetical protein HA496_08680 [Thaumarchaeota archaeon]|jgi:vacuolar-type H+-ATPase subunit E/Vma4|nr:hypothetical protein [Nitrososphaerota archaeon]
MNDSSILTTLKASENISRRILEQAEEVREKMLSEARRNAEEIIARARKNAEEKKRKLIKQGVEDLERFKEQELIKIKMEYRKRVYDHVWSLIDSIISAAISALQKIREQEERYKAFLSKAIANALDMVSGEEIILHIDKRDEKIVKHLIKPYDGKRFKIIPDLTTVGGVVIVSGDSLQEVDETIENRIKLQYKTIREELYNLIFGDLNAGDW